MLLCARAAVRACCCVRVLLACCLPACCAVLPRCRAVEMAVFAAAKVAREQGYGTADDKIVVTAGVPFNVEGTTNILRVASCDERLLSDTDSE